jgi:hypothetical protein
LRRGWRRFLVVAGVGSVVAAALGAGIVCVCIDALIHLPALVRAAALVALLIAGGLAGRRLVRRLRPLGDDLALALRVEELFPTLDDALASSMQFERQRFGSPALRQATLRRASREAEKCDFRDLIDRRPAGRAFAAAFVAVAAAVTLACLHPATAQTGLLRLIDPFGDHPWPPQTMLTVEAPEWLPLGEAFVLRGGITGVIPERVTFGFALDGSSSSEQPVLVAQGDAEGSFTVRLEPNRVPRSFRFRVRANDAEAAWRTVRVVTPPHLVLRDGRPSPQLHLIFPGYTDMSPVDLPDGGTALECVTGTMVRIRAATDRPIARVWIELAGDSPRPVVAAALLPLAAPAPLGSLATNAIDREVRGPHPGRAEADGGRFELSFRPYVSGLYFLRFADAAGLDGRRTIDLRVTPDPPPAVSMERPAASQGDLGFLPTATIPLNIGVDDPTFAVRRVWLEYRCGPDEAVQRLPLYDHAVFGAAVPKLLTPAAGPLRLRLPSVRIEQKLDLVLFRHADGRPLAEGDNMTAQAAADDFDDVTVPKPAGRSHEVELHVVGPVALLAAVQKGEADIQWDLQDLLRLQREALDQTAPAEVRHRQDGSLAADDVDKLLRAEELQQQLRTRLGGNRDGLRSTVERLLQSLRDNPLPSTRDRDRLEGAAAELDRLAREELGPVEPLLSQARTERAPVAPEARKSGPLPRAVEHQRNAEGILRGLLDALKPWTNAREVRADAAALNREQNKLARERAALESLGLLGKPPQQLAPGQRERLGRLAERQAALAELAGELLGKVDRKLAETQSAGAAKEADAAAREARAAELEQQVSSSDAGGGGNSEGPRRDARQLRQQATEARAAASADRREADALAAAREAAQRDPAPPGDVEPPADGSIAGRQRQAAEKLARNELGQARRAQEAADRMLKAVQNALLEKNDTDSDRLAKKKLLAAAESDLDLIIQDQEQLRQHTEDAMRIADPDQRRQALERLAREQEDVRQRTRELAQRLTRLHGEQPADELRRAARAMDQIRDTMDDGDPAADKHDDTLDRLDEARDRLDQTRRDVEDELQREAMAKLLDALRGLKDRQQSQLAECERLFQEAKQAGAWSRPRQKSLGDLATAEAVLAGELGPLVRKQSETAKVIAHLLGEVADSLAEIGPAVERTLDGPMDMGSWEADRRTVQDPQQLALKRLTQVIDALKDEPPNASPAGGARPEQGRDNAGRDSVPPLAHLKLLRALQAELNERTGAFAKQHPDPSKLTALELAELEAIRKAQAALADLFNELDLGTPSREGVIPLNRGGQHRFVRAFLARSFGVNAQRAVDGAGQTPEPPDRLEKQPRLPAHHKDADKDMPKPVKSDSKPADEDQGGKAEAAAKEVATLRDQIAREMQDADEKLKNRDTGDATRRLQEDALHNIDKLIDFARNPPPRSQQQPTAGNLRQQSGQQQQSQSSQVRRERREARRRQMEQQARESGRQPATGTPSANGPSGRPGQPGSSGARSDRQPDQLADVVKDIWGHLPESMRQEVDHYYRDRFMPRYRDLVQEYYMRLAERDRARREGH